MVKKEYALNYPNLSIINSYYKIIWSDTIQVELLFQKN